LISPVVEGIADAALVAGGGACGGGGTVHPRPIPLEDGGVGIGGRAAGKQASNCRGRSAAEDQVIVHDVQCPGIGEAAGDYSHSSAGVTGQSLKIGGTGPAAAGQGHHRPAGDADGCEVDLMLSGGSDGAKARG